MKVRFDQCESFRHIGYSVNFTEITRHVACCHQPSLVGNAKPTPSKVPESLESSSGSSTAATGNDMTIDSADIEAYKEAVEKYRQVSIAPILCRQPVLNIDPWTKDLDGMTAIRLQIGLVRHTSKLQASAKQLRMDLSSVSIPRYALLVWTMSLSTATAKNPMHGRRFLTSHISGFKLDSVVS